MSIEVAPSRGSHTNHHTYYAVSILWPVFYTRCTLSFYGPGCNSPCDKIGDQMDKHLAVFLYFVFSLFLAYKICTFVFFFNTVPFLLLQIKGVACFLDQILNGHSRAINNSFSGWSWVLSCKSCLAYSDFYIHCKLVLCYMIVVHVDGKVRGTKRGWSTKYFTLTRIHVHLHINFSMTNLQRFSVKNMKLQTRLHANWISLITI